MCCKLAVISTDCRTGPREILDPSYNKINNYLKENIEMVEYGILVPEKKPKKIVEAIEYYLNDKNYSNYIEKVKVRVYDFSKNKITREYKDVLEIG